MGAQLEACENYISMGVDCLIVHTTGDTHIYSNHFDQVRLQLTRQPRPLPRMILNPDVKDIFGFRYEDFRLEGYDPYPAIKGQVSV